jgi:hypothetical protein
VKQAEVRGEIRGAQFVAVRRSPSPPAAQPHRVGIERYQLWPLPLERFEQRLFTQPRDFAAAIQVESPFSIADLDVPERSRASPLAVVKLNPVLRENSASAPLSELLLAARDAQPFS